MHVTRISTLNAANESWDVDVSMNAEALFVKGCRNILHLKLLTSGSVPGGLVARPGLPMAFYPLGSTVVVRHIGTAAPFNRQAFLVGHEHTISCVDLSPSGKYLVTGEGHDVGTKVRT